MRNRCALTTTARWSWILLAVPIAAAGCGGSSVESKVASETGGDVSSCRAVGIVDEGKIYSCQTDGTTVCVMVDGSDVFDASARARQQGIAC